MFLLPIIAIVLLFVLIYERERNIIKSTVITWLLYTVISWASIEILGSFYLWTKATVAFVWLAVIIVCGYLIWRKRLWKLISTDATYNSETVQCIKRHKFLVAATIILLSLIFVGALLRSPNNVDSMAYHLPRIRHWVQNKSARPYAANINTQVRYPALAEYMIAQIAILGAHDRLFNLYQTMAYVISGVLVYTIGRRLQVSRKIAFVSMWIFWSIPMAVAQAFSTQTDNLACTFLLIYIYFLLDFIQAEHLKADRRGLCDGVRLAACVMLGYLCKPTIGFAMVIFFIWMCVVRLLKKDSFVVLIKYIIVGAVTAVILFTPSLLKAYDTYVVNRERLTELSETITVANTLAQDSHHVTDALQDHSILIIHCVQNIARNSTSAYFAWWNEMWLRLTEKLSYMLSYNGRAFHIQEGMAFWGCDQASAPALMVISILMGVCFVMRSSRTNREQSMFVICAVLSFFAQCALMSYTPFRIRYLVGVMALLAICAGIVLDNLRVCERSRLNIGIWMIALCMPGWINTYYYEMYQTIDGFSGSSIHKYTMDPSGTFDEDVYQSIVDVINGNNFTSIGLQDQFGFEYILWQKISGLQRLESVNVENTYGVYEDMSFHPECIIWQTNKEENLTEEIECHGEKYVQIWSISGDKKFFGLYKPVGQ